VPLSAAKSENKQQRIERQRWLRTTTWVDIVYDLLLATSKLCIIATSMSFGIDALN